MGCRKHESGPEWDLHSPSTLASLFSSRIPLRLTIPPPTRCHCTRANQLTTLPSLIQANPSEHYSKCRRRRRMRGKDTIVLPAKADSKKKRATSTKTLSSSLNQVTGRNGGGERERQKGGEIRKEEKEKERVKRREK